MGRPCSGGPRGVSGAFIGCRRTSLRPDFGVVGVHGGVKFYSGAGRAARAYVERDRSRADDYYLSEGTGVAERLTATPEGVERVGFNRVNELSRRAGARDEVVPPAGRHLRRPVQSREAAGDRIRSVKIVEQPAVQPLVSQGRLDGWHV